MATILSPTEAVAALAALPQWAPSPEGKAISRRFQFESFRVAFGFMAEVAIEAEKLNHHPEWSNVYRTIEVRLTTHDAGGLTALDIELAQRMDAIAASRC